MSPNRKKRRATLQKQGVPASTKQTRITDLGDVLAQTAGGIVMEAESTTHPVVVMATRGYSRAEIAAELCLLADELESQSS